MAVIAALLLSAAVFGVPGKEHTPAMLARIMMGALALLAAYGAWANAAMIIRARKTQRSGRRLDGLAVTELEYRRRSRSWSVLFLHDDTIWRVQVPASVMPTNAMERGARFPASAWLDQHGRIAAMEIDRAPVTPTWEGHVIDPESEPFKLPL